MYILIIANECIQIQFDAKHNAYGKYINDMNMNPSYIYAYARARMPDHEHAHIYACHVYQYR